MFDFFFLNLNLGIMIQFWLIFWAKGQLTNSISFQKLGLCLECTCHAYNAVKNRWITTFY